MRKCHKKHLNIFFKQQMLSRHLLTDEVWWKRFGQPPSLTVYPLIFIFFFSFWSARALVPQNAPKMHFLHRCQPNSFSCLFWLINWWSYMAVLMAFLYAVQQAGCRGTEASKLNVSVSLHSAFSWEQLHVCILKQNEMLDVPRNVWNVCTCHSMWPFLVLFFIIFFKYWMKWILVHF